MRNHNDDEPKHRIPTRPPQQEERIEKGIKNIDLDKSISEGVYQPEMSGEKPSPPPSDDDDE